MMPPSQPSPEKVMVPKQISDTNRPVRPSRLYFKARLPLSAYPPRRQNQRRPDQRHHNPALGPVALVNHETLRRPMYHARALQGEQRAGRQQNRAHQKNFRRFHFFSAGRGMNSFSSPGIRPNLPSFHSCLARSMRSLEDETKFHQIWRGPSSGAPPNNIARAGASANMEITSSLSSTS